MRRQAPSALSSVYARLFVSATVSTLVFFISYSLLQ